jgi:hypothetical protein
MRDGDVNDDAAWYRFTCALAEAVGLDLADA